MKKMLFAAVAVVGVCGVSEGMMVGEVINYHLFSGSPHPSLSPVNATIEEKLQNELDLCSKRFQEADSVHLDQSAEELIPKLKVVFLGKDTPQAEALAVKALDEQEEKFYKDGTQLSEVISDMIKMRTGLPVAAYTLALMYDQIGLKDIALLWAKVAYNLGIKQAKQLGQQLLIKMGK